MRFSGILAMSAAVILCTGCSGAEQVHDKNYVRAVAVAGDDAKAAVFAFYGDNEEPIAAVGDNLDELRSEAELNTGKSLFTGHTELVVLGECDYSATLEYLLNEWKVSPSCLVVYGGPYAAYALKNFDAEKLTDAVRKAIEQGKVPECDIVTVLSSFLNGDKSAEIALIGENGIDGKIKLESE